MGSNVNQVAIIGDRIFTDILAGNRIGIYTILVRSISTNSLLKGNKTIVIEKLFSKLLGA